MMNKQQFQAKVKKLKKEKGLTLQDIADKIKFSKSSVERACQNWYKGDSSRVYWAFNQALKCNNPQIKLANLGFLADFDYCIKITDKKAVKAAKSGKRGLSYGYTVRRAKSDLK